jgi:hypothetical protein
MGMARYDLGFFVKQSFDFLKTKFGADGVPQPSIVIDQSVHPTPATYNASRNLLFLQTKDMEKLDSIGLHYVIGEEVSHYLHYQVNPWLLKTNQAFGDKANSAKEEKDRENVTLDYIVFYNFIEFVGSYGALLYLEKYAGRKKASEFGHDIITNLIDDKKSFTDKESCDLAKHGVGYLLGAGAYCEFGGSYLMAAARINSLEQIKSLIMQPRLDNLKNLLETRPHES